MPTATLSAARRATAAPDVARPLMPRVPHSPDVPHVMDAVFYAGRPESAVAPDPEPLTQANFRRRLLENFARARGRLAASYARKSNDDADGIEAQHEINAAAALADGYFIPDAPDIRFDDNHVSGATTQRPGLERLLAAARAGAPWCRVYVKDRSRWGRFEDLRYHMYLEMVLVHECDVTLRFVHRGTPRVPASAGPMADIFNGFFDLIDAEKVRGERHDTMRRTRGGKRKRVKDGFYPGGVHVPYGTTRVLVDRASKTVRVAEVAAGDRVVRTRDEGFMLRWATDGSVAVVTRIFAWLVADVSMGEIARRLAAEGVAAPGLRFARRKTQRHTPRWTPEHIAAIAANPIYKGELLWGRRRLGLEPVEDAAAEANEGTSPLVHRTFMSDPPVTPAVWDAAQAVLARNRAQKRRSRASARYLVSGMVRCRRCGGGLSGHTRARAGRCATAAAYRYYVHNARREGADACPYAHRSVSADLVDGFASWAVTRVLARDDVRQEVDAALAALCERAPDALARERAEVKAKVERLTAILADARKRLSKTESPSIVATWTGVVEDRGPELDAARTRLAALELAGERVEDARARAARHFGAGPTVGVVAAFERADPAQRRGITRHVVRAVVVDFDRDVVDFAIDPLVSVPDLGADGAATALVRAVPSTVPPIAAPPV